MGIMKGIDFVFGQLGLSRYIVSGMFGFSISRPTSQDKSMGKRVDFMFCCCGGGCVNCHNKISGLKKEKPKKFNSLKSIN